VAVLGKAAGEAEGTGIPGYMGAALIGSEAQIAPWGWDVVGGMFADDHRPAKGCAVFDHGRKDRRFPVAARVHCASHPPVEWRKAHPLPRILSRIFLLEYFCYKVFCPEVFRSTCTGNSA
jgi:hypothetical protein